MHEQDCHLREKEWDGMGLVLKIPLITANECQTGIDNNILNDHLQYLLCQK